MMKSRYSITPGMNKVLGKRAKRVCPVCHLQIPIYPGRYPQKCPHCGSEFVDEEVREVVDLLIEKRIRLDDVLRPLVREKKEEKNANLDRIMQVVVQFKLLDELLGVDISGKSDNFWLYFSDEAEEETIEKLCGELKSYSHDARVYPSNSDGAKWAVSVLNARALKNPEIEGEIENEIPTEGDLEVK